MSLKYEPASEPHPESKHGILNPNTVQWMAPEVLQNFAKPNSSKYDRRCDIYSYAPEPSEREFFIDNLLVRIHFNLTLLVHPRTLNSYLRLIDIYSCTPEPSALTKRAPTFTLGLMT